MFFISPLECHCRNPLIKCDNSGCRCVFCGRPQRTNVPELTYEEIKCVTGKDKQDIDYTKITKEIAGEGI